VAEALSQFDYWVTVGSGPAQVVRNYAEVTGKPPRLPEWATGFWQCKLRYRTQEELLEVAREYRRRELPLSVIVIDYFNWTRQGEWRFDPREWPDPDAMVKELEAMGVKVMVSIWPTVNPLAETYREMEEAGLLVSNEQGLPLHLDFFDKGQMGRTFVRFYDATNPVGRRYVWNRVKEGYYNYGIKAWWLDACEPEVRPEQTANLRYHVGPGAAVANIYPLLHAKGFYEGMREEGEDDVVLLCRSAWAGSQRYGALVWSGDVDSSFDALRRQIPAGLNIGLSGIPWWTTDIGGFVGGDVRSEEFKELLVRWFQFGVFCPVCRLHGFRQPGTMFGSEQTGAGNEVWSYGEEVYGILRSLLDLRERLRPYIEHMRVAEETGLPVMRPLFLNFPSDPLCWEVDDQFLLGDDVLIAPVLEYRAREREVYLPAGSTWYDA
jgi:alpha-D-xyloside xylohydrolase